MMVDTSSEALRIIIPCLAEESPIGSLVGPAPAKLVESRDRLIVVDNGSSDRTAEVARAAGAEVVAEPSRGYGRAWLAGVRAAENGIAVFLDGDVADHPDDLERLIAPVRESVADLVVARGATVKLDR